MPSTKIQRITGITSPHSEFLDMFDTENLDPSPLPLLRARIDLATAPRHIRACLKQTLEHLTPEFIEGLTERLTGYDSDTIHDKLLEPITQAWSPPGGSMWTTPPKPVVPRNLPQAVQDFRFELKKYSVPITDNMEVALTRGPCKCDESAPGRQHSAGEDC